MLSERLRNRLLKRVINNKEYLPIDGLVSFVSAAQSLILGEDSPAIKEKRVATTQTLSGTGALRVGAEFIKRFSPGTAVLISEPTWTNHLTIFGDQGIKVIKHRYFDSKTNGLDFTGFVEDLKAAPNGSVVLLHGCAHNPTGVDPTQDQWKQLCEITKEKQFIPFFDNAYQGYATGDVNRDAFSVRHFVAEGLECFVSQSFAKNFGLYGERAGSLSIVCKSDKIAQAVLSQLKLVIRPMYSNPPIHGALIVSLILNTPALFQEWLQEVKMMSKRIQDMRQALFDVLKEKTGQEWVHILNQIGMFTYTGLAEAQVEQLITKYSIHMMKNGRISMAGINTKNVRYIAESIASVVKELPAQKL